MTSNIEWGHTPDGRAEAPLYRSWARRLVHVSGMPSVSYTHLTLPTIYSV